MSDRRSIARSTDEHAVGGALPKSAARSRRGSGDIDASPHAQRFRTATALLVGFAIGAILIAIAVAASSKPSHRSVPWSTWSPPDNGTLGARDIADHVAPYYRLSAVNQLAVVTVVNLESQAAAAAAAQAAANGTTPVASSGLQVAVQTNPN